MRTAARLMTFRSALVMITLGSAVMISGCKPSAEKKAAIEQRINLEIEALFTRIQECQAQGQLAEAITLADKGLANSNYSAQKPRFLSTKVDLLLAQNNDKAASDLIIQMMKTEPQLAAGFCQRVYGYYQGLNRNDGILAWCERLLGLGARLPAGLRSQVMNWKLNTTLAQRDLPAAQKSVDQVLELLAPTEAIPLLQQAFGGLVDSGQHALAAALTRYLADKKDLPAACRDLIVTIDMRCLLTTGDWAKFPAAFDACVQQLPDDPLLKLMRQIFLSLQKGSQRDLIEQASKHVVVNALTKTNSVNFAARLWVESGVSQNKKLLPERLETLLNAKISPIQVGNLFDRYFYDMVNDLDIIRGLCSLGERILSVCNDENTVSNVRVKILDGAFIVDNFDLAVQMLEQGIPGKDKTWHDMSLPKVKAHRAMAQKNPRDAVKYFREFMNAWINSKQEEEFDPTSGIAYSREWILGRNAKRIANILDSIPDKAEADKAREEAKAYFRIAVQKAAADTEAAKLIKEETKDMGL